MKYQETTRPSVSLDTSYYKRLCNLLLQPFDRQEAFRLGLIDGSGNVTKEPTNGAEEAALTPLHRLAFGIRKYILNQPGGNIMLGASSALAALSKVHNRKMDVKDVHRLHEEFKKIHELAVEHKLQYPVEEIILEKYVNDELKEDAPTCNTGAMDNGGTRTPPLALKFKRKESK